MTPQRAHRRRVVRRRLDALAGVLAAMAILVSAGGVALTIEQRQTATQRICQEVAELRTDIVTFLEERPSISERDVDGFRPVSCP